MRILQPQLTNSVFFTVLPCPFYPPTLKSLITVCVGWRAARVFAAPERDLRQGGDQRTASGQGQIQGTQVLQVYPAVFHPIVDFFP